MPCHVLLGGAHRKFPVMEYACGKHGVRAPAHDTLHEMLETARASARDDGDVECIREGARQLEVEAGLGAVPIHAREQYFPCAELLHLAAPGQRIETRRAA